MSAAPVSIEREQAPVPAWEVARRPPPRPLRGLVQDYQGYVESAEAMTRQRQLPGLWAPLIIPFGPELEVAPPSARECFDSYEGGFVAALDETYAVTRWQGVSAGIQVNLSPILARLVFGVPLGQISGRVLPIADVLGRSGRDFAQEVRSAATWEERFGLVDRFLIERLRQAKAPPQGMAWAWRRLVDTGGRVSAGRLASDLGWSHKHLIEQFREYTGLAPKTVARIIRFSRVATGLDEAPRACWSQVALDCGYYDQSHLIRDFIQFTGSPPREFLRRRMTGGGVAG